MENKEISKGSNRRTTQPVNNDEFDFENLTFKPLTQGLGFHPEKKEIPIIKSRISAPQALRPSFVPKATFIPTPKIAPKQIITPRPKIEEAPLEDAQISRRLMAFSIDLLIILMATSLTLFILGLGSGLSIEILLSILSIKEIILFTTGVFSIYFLFYFSILDLSTTVGKSLMGMEIKTLNGKRPVLKDTFFRSLISLLFLPILGIPTLAEIQDKLSETKIYKK